MADEQVSVVIRGSDGARPRCRDRNGRQRRRSVDRKVGDEHRNGRTPIVRAIGGRQLHTRGSRLDDGAAACLSNRGRTRGFVLLHLRRTATRRPHLPVELAQILRPCERGRRQEHHQREGGQKDAVHSASTIRRGAAFRNECSWSLAAGCPKRAGQSRRRGRARGARRSRELEPFEARGWGR